MMVGIPRAMLYYRYKELWETFFSKLNIKIRISEETNKKILNDGINFSVDESCLPSKIYMGHVYSLIGKCDYILIPRVVNYGEGNSVCVKFNALYDIVRNTFGNIKILTYNIDMENGCFEKKGFLNMGKVLGKSYLDSIKAYKNAKQAQRTCNRRKADIQNKIMDRKDKLKILIVSHPYNIYDKLIGYPVIQYINKLGGTPVFTDSIDRRQSLAESKDLSKSLYWLYNKELIGSIKLVEDKIDGVILLTAFPCGPDSLVNELIMRKSKKIPTINIICDELQGEAGLQTRIESFMDIIIEKSEKYNCLKRDESDFAAGY
ncbi:MAG: acyl-CoA dehydratase activase-related protein [Eubacteriales bacterium]|jgi:predicted nucleotide-binding protein (sugar kinase/HSP70/actin superfamily)|nr:acyl-CoA dehydratase activase-related protein [Eubacteriales bacterium]